MRHDLKPPPRPEVWDAVNADSSSCSRKHCDCEKCFYQRARARIRSANVIIVNHALLFALINAGGAQGQRRERPTRAACCFPTTSSCSTKRTPCRKSRPNNFGLSLSSYGVDRALKYLFNPRTKRGLFRKLGGAGSAAARRRRARCVAAVLRFHRRHAAGPAADRSRARSGRGGTHARRPARRAAPDCSASSADKFEDGRERDEILEQKQRVKALQAGLTEWLTLGDKGHVYWAERSGRKQTIVTLRSAPIDVAPALRKHLFGCGTSVVCTSATLAMGGQIEPFAERIGRRRARAPSS